MYVFEMLEASENFDRGIRHEWERRAKGRKSAQMSIVGSVFFEHTLGLKECLPAYLK
jgi:hypothetical protein